MPVPKKNERIKRPAPVSDKAEFLKNLADDYAYWAAKGNVEYATAYERLLFAYTMPPQPDTPVKK